MADYITVSELRDYIGSDTTNFENHAQNCCTAASRIVEKMCDRVFVDAGSTSARYYCADNPYVVCVDDFSTVTGLTVATDDTAAAPPTYGTSWTISTDFTVEPINPSASGITVPFHTIASTGNRTFAAPSIAVPYPVKVTARWGWAAVPQEVTQACLMAAAQLFKLKDAPDGFVGLDGWGPTQVRENKFIRATLSPYMRAPIAIG